MGTGVLCATKATQLGTLRVFILRVCGGDGFFRRGGSGGFRARGQSRVTSCMTVRVNVAINASKTRDPETWTKPHSTIPPPVLQFYLLCGIRNTSSLVSGGSGHYSKQSGLQWKGHFTTTALRTLVNGSAGVGSTLYPCDC